MAGALAGITTVPGAPPAGATGMAVVPLAAGSGHSCALTPAHGVKCWGDNWEGELGDGTSTRRMTPVDVSGLTSGVVAIDAAGGHSCALTNAGGVKCWGDNFYGQLGDGTNTKRLVPVDVSGLTTGVVAVAAGNFHSCALTSAGGVKCWGANFEGILGDGTDTKRTTPVNVVGLASGVTAITAGGSQTCAVTSSGGVKCWGANHSGELGDGTTTQRLTPVNVVGLASGVTAVTAGGSQTCAVTSSGGVKCWGNNADGELGDGTTTNRTTPVEVSGLTSGVTGITAGASHSCALTIAGGVKCWGANSFGELGDGTRSAMRALPADVSGLTAGVVAVAAGYSHSCALTSTGVLKCWGANYVGQLGDGTGGIRSVPVDVSGLASGVTAVAAGYSHSCAVTSAGGVKCWGANSDGQLGDGTTTHRLTPVDASGLASGVTAVATGSNYSCALITGGVKCWGNNFVGQLGDGTSSPRMTPVDVSGLTSGVVAIDAAGGHSCALTSTGGVKCWGSNFVGQLGDGTTTDRWTPVDVSGLTTGVVAVAAGAYHSCALTSTGGVKCWGNNRVGQLGDGTTTEHLTPADVSDLTAGVTAVTAGLAHSCALTSSGGVKCWGYNPGGQLGDGTTTDRWTPVDVSGLTAGVTAVTAGDSHSCGLTSTGGVECWGGNAQGQLGDETRTNRTTPVNVSGLASGVAAITAGEGHSCALTGTGGVKCWGDNHSSQLGDGTAGWIPIDAIGTFYSDALAPTATVTVPADGAYFVVGQNAPASYACVDEAGGSGVASCVGTVVKGVPIDTGSAGVKSFTVTAADHFGNTASVTHSYTVVVPESASAVLPPGGGSVTTDVGGTGPTASDPVETTVSSPNEGAVSIAEGTVTQATPSGFTLLGLQIDMTAPPATPDAPLGFVFDIDAALLPPGETKDTVSLLKDGALLPECPGATTLPTGVSACVSGRAEAPSGGGDVRLSVISVSASTWNLAVGSPVPPRISISSPRTTEGDAGYKLLSFGVFLSQVSALPVTVHYATADGTATAGSDYATASGTLSLAPGQAFKVVVVLVMGDTVHESNETFTTTLSSPSGATIQKAVGVATIVDDDPVLPSAPTFVRAVPGNAQATVSWSPPVSNGGSPVTDYLVTPYLGTVAQTGLARTFFTTARSGVITGLTNATTYTLRVAAINMVGTGPAAATGAIRVGAPVAPVVSAVGSLTQAKVSWTAPAGNGAAVTSYVVTTYLGTVLQSTKTHTVSCTPLPCVPARTWTVTGLTNGSLYTFRVAAVNSRGTGPPGATTITVGPATLPGTPTAVRAVGGAGSATVSWAVPANGSATISAYLITPYRGGIAEPVVTVGGTLTTATVPGLTPGQSHTFRVEARSVAGTGPISTASNAVTPT